jgi:subtilisin family serine protease
MKKISTLMLKFILMVLGIAVSVSLYSQDYKNGVLQGTIRIKVKPTIASALQISKSKSTGIVTTGVKELDRLNETYAVSDMKRVFRYSPQFEEKHIKYGLNLWYEINIGQEVNSTEVVEAYSNLSVLEKAEPILEQVLIDGSTVPVYLSGSDKGSAGAYFNDPYLPRQWHYNNTGQSGGVPGSDINAYKAWDITKGSGNVIVSIHDQGVDVDHEDLKDAMWINQAEMNGIAGVDDDGNGYKDDIYGFNFAKNMGTIDAMSHGSHVAGTIGAVNNNGIGVSGIAGGSGSGDGVRIMSCQILGGTGSGNTPDSYVYAADMGSVISQNSWGYSNPGYYEQVVLDAIDYFIAEAGNLPGSPMKGGIVIFAAGNSADYGEWYPAYYESCVSVAALNASSYLTVYSNYGPWVDLAAPGGQSEDNANIDPNSPYKNGVLSTLDNDSYGFMDGTSMACPHVSGVAALVVSKYGGASFTVAELKSRLLTGTRFLDTIAYNQSYAGMMGTGEIDALLALAEDHHIAPDKINDLELSGIAQDFANLKWTVPSDNDDHKPTGFEVLYSTHEISLSDLQYAKIIHLNSRLEPGERDSLEISYLKPLTTYYFSVRSVDRWGNKSDFSNPVTGMTNAGPDAQIDPNVSSLEIEIDASVDPSQSRAFALLNNGEGSLKWEATTHHKYANPSSISNANYPRIQAYHYTNGKSISSSKIKESSRLVPYSIDNSTYEDMTYLNYDSWSYWVIGETDTTYTNSSATRFLVSSSGGFNLTTVEALLMHKEATGPVILEIFEGQNIEDAKLAYRQEVTYTSDYGSSYITLSEHLFFEQGKYFWIVFHVPAMNSYPLGAGIETNKEDSQNCYYSSDLGRTWARFEDVYYDNQLVWAVTAGSRYSDIGKYITLSPDKGTVISNSSANITATVDASTMINGSYAANIAISTNETNEPLLELPVNLTITGHKPVIASSHRTDAGGVLVGGEKTFEVKLQNTGLGLFLFANNGYDENWNPVYFEISNPQFTYISGLNSYFEARTEQTVKFKFEPTNAGNASTIVRINDINGNTYSFELFGYGIEPPVIAISPSENNTSGHAIGDLITGQFSISNTGNYPLDYFVPVFADGSNMAEIPANIHRFGYSRSTNPGGINPEPAYEWTEISGTGTEISNNLNEELKRFYQVSLGFEFPFFGKKETSVFISKYSTLSFDTEGYIWSMVPLHAGWEGLPDRVVSVLGLEAYPETKGHIYYQRFPDKFVVQWENVAIGGMGTGTYQAVLHDNGNISIFIKELKADAWTTVENIASIAYIGIEDQTRNDYLLVTDYNNRNIEAVSNNSVIRFVSPGQGLFTTLTNPFGSVQPGNSVTLEYTINTDSLYVANYSEKLAIISNDPVNNPGLFTANFDISSGGDPDVIVSATALDFGQVFQNDTKAESFFIENSGKAPIVILSAQFANGYYNINGTFPQALKPGRALFYDISINTSTLGTYSDVLTLSTNEGKTYQITLSGEVIEAPAISTGISEITETMASGAVKLVDLTITNPGKHDLDFAPVGNSWMSVSKKTMLKTLAIPDYTYYFKNSKDTGGPEFQWEDISSPENLVTVGDLWYGENPWSGKIDLPFTFNYYGTDYNYLYVGYNGLVSFTPDQELSPFGGESIPNTASPNNFIAALYGFLGQSSVSEYPLTGYYFNADSEKAVIQFTDFNTGFGMTGPMSIQIILYKNGNIKFQYKMHSDGDADVITPFGIIGIENIDGTDGVQVANRNYTDRNGLAYELYPVRKYTVPAGQSMDFTVELNARELYAGEYTDVLKLMNNVPLSQDLSIPVRLTVTGDAKVTAPDSVDLGKILVVETPGDWGSTFTSYEKEFTISNTGTASTEIAQFDLSKVSSSIVYAYIQGEDWFGNKIWQWTDVTYLPAYDWESGELIPLYLLPKSVMKYKVEITPTSASAVRDTLLVVTDSGTLQIPIIADVYMPPVIRTEQDTVKVFASDASYTETKSLVIDNSAGGYELRYGLEIDYKRSDTNAGVFNKYGLSENAEAPKLIAIKNEGPLKKNKNVKASSYNRTLSYEAAEQPETFIGYGGSSAFYTTTAFKAPSNGFNLTDVQTWYTAGSWLNSKIKVQVYSGSSDIYAAKLVHSQTYEYNITEPNNTGELLIIHLDKNIILYPNEYFFITFGYESGAVYPQGVVTMPSIVKNRYLYGNGNGVWYDLVDAGSTLESFGWMVRALEAEYKSAAWVSLSSLTMDTITAGLTGEVKLDFKAGFAKPGDNYANLIIKSNDPLKREKKVTLLLHLNNGPEFTADQTAYYVYENEVISFNVAAKDAEGDNFSMDLKSKPSFVTGTVSSDIMTISCAPTYNDAGVYTIIIEGTDILGNKTEAGFDLIVKNINRPPVVINPIGNINMGISDMKTINLADIIADPRYCG